MSSLDNKSKGAEFPNEFGPGQGGLSHSEIFFGPGFALYNCMKIVLILITALFVFGCGSQPGLQKRSSTPAPENLISANSCQGNELSSRVTSISGNDQDFRQSVGDLVSVSLNPAELGSVSGALNGATGVELKMVLTFDTSHQIISESSKFRIIIKDSFVGTAGTNGNLISPIEVVHAAGSQLSGSFDPSQRILHVQFSDAYGHVSVDGQIQNGQLNGQVQFVNTKAWNGSTPRQGTLGRIQATSCSFQ